MKQKITIKDIARESGVSETTISRYLNKKYEYMSAETKAKIANVIESLDYRPNQIARSLKSNKSKIIGAVIADIENPFSSTIIKGLSDRCEKLGYSLLIAISDGILEKEQRHIERFIDNQVAGLIINTCGNNEDYLTKLDARSFPIVLLDRGITGNHIDTVTTNNYEIGSIAVNYLIESGFHSLGFFVHSLNNSVRRDRMRAFEERRGYAEASEVYVVDSDNTAALYNALIDFRKKPAPRVIFAANGFMTLSVLEAMKDLNYKVNKDFGIIGFDDLPWSKVVDPGITTIAQSSYMIAREACNLLVDKIEHPELHEAVSFIELPAKLVIRDSTKI